MADLWSLAFPVGTEWSQIGLVNSFNWSFEQLSNALDKGGVLHDKIVWMFGCTEPQMVPIKKGENFIMQAIHIPAVTAVVCDHCPSEQIGVKSVQMVEESIIPMKQMKLSWVPYAPEEDFSKRTAEKVKSKIFVMKCSQRRTALKQLKEERLKKFEYCLPYVFNPLKDNKVEYDTAVPIVYTADDGSPPIVAEFDWEFDEEKEFLDSLEESGVLPKDQREKFWEYCKEEVKKAKAKIAEDKARRKKLVDDIPAETVEAFKNMKVYKFYPSKTDETPDIQEFQSNFVNRYYGKADAVFPPLKEKPVGNIFDLAKRQAAEQTATIAAASAPVVSTSAPPPEADGMEEEPKKEKRNGTEEADKDRASKKSKTTEKTTAAVKTSKKRKAAAPPKESKRSGAKRVSKKA